SFPTRRSSDLPSSFPPNLRRDPTRVDLLRQLLPGVWMSQAAMVLASVVLPAAGDTGDIGALLAGVATARAAIFLRHGLRRPPLQNDAHTFLNSSSGSRSDSGDADGIARAYPRRL